mmetsp:Transcript_34270/g.62562  ORF Transcript_34270/g.62562 Transcript_34270/m.62562 type:complete len:228 (+) Transcript_34270:129-812(+)
MLLKSAVLQHHHRKFLAYPNPVQRQHHFQVKELQQVLGVSLLTPGDGRHDGLLTPGDESTQPEPACHQHHRRPLACTQLWRYWQLDGCEQTLLHVMQWQRPANPEQHQRCPVDRLHHQRLQRRPQLDYHRRAHHGLMRLTQANPQQYQCPLERLHHRRLRHHARIDCQEQARPFGLTWLAQANPRQQRRWALDCLHCHRLQHDPLLDCQKQALLWLMRLQPANPQRH